MSTSAGRVLLLHKGDYDSSETYSPMDEVLYQGSTYVCKQTSTGNAPTNTTYWQMMAQKGTDGVATGGATGQFLMKKSGTDYDTEWGDALTIAEATEYELVRGKNIAPVTLGSGSKNDVEYTVNSNKTISTSGTASEDTYLTVCNDFDLTPYLNQYVVFSGCVGGTSDYNTYKMYCQLYDANNDLITSFDMYDGEIQIPLFNENIDHARILLFINGGQNMNGKTFSPMICTANDWAKSQTYEACCPLPLRDSVAKTFKDANIVNGKNLGVFRPFVGTESGISTVISDKSAGELTLNGSASGSAILCISDPVANPDGSQDGSLNLKAGTYVLSCPQYSVLGNSFYIAVVDKNGNKKATLKPQSASDDHVRFVLGSDTNGLFIALYISSGAYLSSQKLQVMICTQDEWYSSRTYEPYYRTTNDRVQAIIDAATNATDFAAFKAAMATI